MMDNFLRPLLLVFRKAIFFSPIFLSTLAACLWISVIPENQRDKFICILLNSQLIIINKGLFSLLPFVAAWRCITF